MKAKPSPEENTSTFRPSAGWPGSLSLFGQAWKAVRGNPDFVYIFVGIMGGLAVLNYVIQPTQFFAFDLSGNSKQSDSSLVVTFIAALVSLVLTAPLTLYQLRVSEGKEVSVRAVFDAGLKRTIPFVALNLLIILAVVVGLILFIVPGIIIGFRLIIANYVFFDKNVGPIEAIKQSFEITKGNFGEIAGYIGLIMLLSLAAGILNLTVPVFGNMAANLAVVVYGVVGAWLYRWIAKQ